MMSCRPVVSIRSDRLHDLIRSVTFGGGGLPPSRQFRAFTDPRCHVLSPEPWWRSPGCTSLLHATGDYVLATDAHMSVGAGVTAVRRNLEYVPE